MAAFPIVFRQVLFDSDGPAFHPLAHDHGAVADELLPERQRLGFEDPDLDFLRLTAW